MGTRVKLFLGFWLILIQLFVTYPIGTWSNNLDSLIIGLSEAHLYIGLTFLGTGALSFILSQMVPRKWKERFLPYLLGLAILIFVQQNFLVWDYGVLDGATLNFAKNTSLGFLELGIWILAFLAFWYFRKFLTRQFSNGILILGLATIVPAFIALLSAPEKTAVYSLTEDSKFSFSKDENVIVILLDAFQSDVFQKLVAENSEFNEMLNGFTFYENNVSTFSRTFPTLPLFLTGETYKKDEPVLDFVADAYQDRLLEDLIDADWHVGLYTPVRKPIPASPDIASNIIGGHLLSEKVATYIDNINVSVFRGVPHFMKPAIYNSGNFVIRRDLMKESGANTSENNADPRASYPKKHKVDWFDFEENLNQFVDKNSSKPTFKLFHFIAPHAPFLMNREMEVGNFEHSFKSYEDFSYAGLKILDGIIDTLKAEEIYDNSTVLILSDHGRGFPNRYQYNPVSKEYYPVEKFGPERAAAKSILLLKPANSRGAFNVSSSPTSGIDVAPTLAKSAGVPFRKYDGIPVTDIPENAKRVRDYFYYVFRPESKFLDDFQHFRIRGHAREDRSWSDMGIVKPSPSSLSSVKHYSLGQTLGYGNDFGNDTDIANKFLRSDAFAIERSHVVGREGVISIDLPLERKLKTGQEYVLEYAIPARNTGTTEVVINGQPLSVFSYREITRGGFWHNDRIRISGELMASSKTVSLEFRNLNGSKQELSSLKLSVISPPEMTAMVPLKFENDIGPYYPKGFKRLQGKFVWSTDKKSSLLISTKSDICQNNILKIQFFRINKGVDRDGISTSMNGSELPLVNATERKNTSVRSYDCSDVNINGPIEIQFSTQELTPYHTKYFPGNVGVIIGYILFEPTGDNQ